MYLASQICELVALIMDLIAYHFKTKKKILIVSNIGCFFNILHYFLLGALSGAAAKTITFIRNAYIAKNDKNKKNVIIMIIFITLYIIFGVVTYKNIYSILPTFIAILYLLCIWNGNELQVKRASFICSILWIIYNIFIMSYAGIFTNSILLISTFIAYYNERKNYDRRNNKKRIKKV